MSDKRNMEFYNKGYEVGYETGCRQGKIDLSGKTVNPEKEGKMLYFKINCPFCEGNSVSDVIDSIEKVDGQWECSNGHQFVVKYLGKIE